MRYDLLFVEIVSVILFCAGIYYLRRFGRDRVYEFVMIAVYGLILEELDMRIFKTYHYSPDFVITFMAVPVSIALLWAVILAGAMSISDRLGLPEPVRPFMDAILAVWIDLALDAIAIRLEYWTWVIPLSDGWYGVPAGNLYAWMWVAFSYSIMARFLRKKFTEQSGKRWLFLLLPPMAYVGLFISMATVGLTGKLFHLETQNQRMVIFWAQFIIFCGIVWSQWRHRKPLKLQGEPYGLWKWSRVCMHLFFIIAYFALGLHQTLPSLGYIAFAILFVEIAFMKLFLERNQIHGKN